MVKEMLQLKTSILMANSLHCIAKNGPDFGICNQVTNGLFLTSLIPTVFAYIPSCNPTHSLFIMSAPDTNCIFPASLGLHDHVLDYHSLLCLIQICPKGNLINCHFWPVARCAFFTHVSLLYYALKFELK